MFDIKIREPNSAGFSRETLPIAHCPLPMTTNICVMTAPRVYLLGSRPVQLGLVQYLEADQRHQVLQYSDPLQFLRELVDERNGCIVADLHMPGMSGLQLIRELENRQSKLTVILTSADSDMRACRTAFLLGAFDFIEPNCPVREIVDRILQGLTQNRQLCEQANCTEQSRTLVSLLSNRERAVADLLASGNTLKEVGESLQISPQTASKHRIAIFQKLDIKSEVELYRLLHEAQLPTPHRSMPTIATPNNTIWTGAPAQS